MTPRSNRKHSYSRFDNKSSVTESLKPKLATGICQVHLAIEVSCRVEKQNEENSTCIRSPWFGKDKWEEKEEILQQNIVAMATDPSNIRLVFKYMWETDL